MLTKIPKHIMATMRKFISYSRDGTRLGNKSVGQSSSTWPPRAQAHGNCHLQSVACQECILYLTFYICIYITTYFEIVSTHRKLQKIVW